MTTLGSRLKSIRKENNLTQEELGKILNISKYSISLYEHNKVSPSDDFKAQVATFFNVSVDWLLGLTDEKLPVNRIKEEKDKYRKASDLYWLNIPQKIAHLTENEKSSLQSYIEFAIELIEKDRREQEEK